MSLSDVTPLAIVAIMIVLTDRWVVRFYRLLKESLEIRALSDRELMLVMMNCSDSLLAIKESLDILPLTSR